MALWGWLDPKRATLAQDAPDHWTVQCPCKLDGCHGRVEIWQVDDGSAYPQRWLFAGPCSHDCDPREMVERWSRVVHLANPDAQDPLPVEVVDACLLGRIQAALSSDGPSAEAWAGSRPFRSAASRVRALGYRMVDAGISPRIALVAQAMLAEQLGIPFDAPFRLAHSGTPIDPADVQAHAAYCSALCLYT